jgi:HAD superfamily hydrolase (TIGR01490 family)
MTSQPVAVFDLDCTILDTDCENLWAEFMFAHNVVDASFIQRIAEFYEDYEKGHLDGVSYEEFFLRPLAENPPEKLHLLRDAYLAKIAGHFRPQMLARLKQHQEDHFALLLISFSNSFLVEPIAHRLGFKHVICSQVEVKNGRYTGRVKGIPAQKDVKVKFFKEWLEKNGCSLQDSWGYGDSRNDLPLLTVVDHPVAVSPDPVLRRHARENNWEILDA